MNNLATNETSHGGESVPLQANSHDLAPSQPSNKDSFPLSITELDTDTTKDQSDVSDNTQSLNTAGSVPSPNVTSPANDAGRPLVLTTTEISTANDEKTYEKKEASDALTDISADDEAPENDNDPTANTAPTPVVSSSKKTRPQYKYDPEKITLRFLFANRDGLAVTVECKPSDTVGEVKGALLSVWPEGEFVYCHLCLTSTVH